MNRQEAFAKRFVYAISIGIAAGIFDLVIIVVTALILFNWFSAK